MPGTLTAIPEGRDACHMGLLRWLTGPEGLAWREAEVSRPITFALHLSEGSFCLICARVWLSDDLFATDSQ